MRYPPHKDVVRVHNSKTLITYNGKTQNMTQWARELNISRAALIERIYHRRLPLDKALRPGRRQDEASRWGTEAPSTPGYYWAAPKDEWLAGMPEVVYAHRLSSGQMAIYRPTEKRPVAVVEFSHWGPRVEHPPLPPGVDLEGEAQ